MIGCQWPGYAAAAQDGHKVVGRGADAHDYPQSGIPHHPQAVLFPGAHSFRSSSSLEWCLIRCCWTFCRGACKSLIWCMAVTYFVPGTLISFGKGDGIAASAVQTCGLRSSTMSAVFKNIHSPYLKEAYFSTLYMNRAHVLLSLDCCAGVAGGAHIEARTSERDRRQDSEPGGHPEDVAAGSGPEVFHPVPAHAVRLHPAASN